MPKFDEVTELKIKIRTLENKVRNSKNPLEQRQLRSQIGNLNKELKLLTLQH